MRDLDLVRLYWPVELRPAFDALFAIDDALGDVVTSSTQPALGAIRLAWWRDALERLDTYPPPPEPRLQAAAELLQRGISGAMLAQLEDGWATLLDEQPDPARIRQRGGRLFALAARLLGDSAAEIAEVGAIYALASAGRQTGRVSLLLATRELLEKLPSKRFGKRVRPLTMLAALARRDARRRDFTEAQATPGRAAALLRHWWAGR